MNTYTTRNDAIEAEIVKAIEASGEVTNAWAEYDVDAIANAVLGDYDAGYAMKVDEDEFWQVVADNAR